MGLWPHIIASDFLPSLIDLVRGGLCLPPLQVLHTLLVTPPIHPGGVIGVRDRFGFTVARDYWIDFACLLAATALLLRHGKEEAAVPACVVWCLRS